jgi:predicted NUDIX family phosphoesterase
MTTNHRLILAVPAEGLPPSARRTSFIPMAEEQLWTTLYGAGLWLGPRPHLEEMPSFRQIIPYVALKCGDRWVRYTRTPAGGEQRLHGRVSIGLGGHIDLSDVVATGDAIDLVQTLKAAARREVEEELVGVEPVSQRWAGLLVDNDSPVGRVHIGVVAVWELASVPHGSGEDAIGDTGLTTLEELKNDEAQMETWSSLLIPYLQ